MRFAPLGLEGQRRLAEQLGALGRLRGAGSHVADLLVRAGVGRLRIVDRDFLELSNLQRQTLFDEQDLAAELPKAVAAAAKLAASIPRSRRADRRRRRSSQHRRSWPPAST